jgi:hypothetical protein
MSNKQKQKKNRRQTRLQRYESQVTPTHYVRIMRIPLQIDASLKLFVIRTASGRERKVHRDLERAGFTVYLPINVVMAIRRGKATEVLQRPAAGYLFVGFPEGVSGREALWRYHDETVAAAAPVSFRTNTGDMAVHEPRIGQERPFFRVMGPFKAESLQRFVDSLDPEPVAVLWEGDTPVAKFPAIIADLVDGEVLGLVDIGALLEMQEAA